MLLGAGLFAGGALTYHALSRPEEHRVIMSFNPDYQEVQDRLADEQRKLEMANDVMVRYFISQISGNPDSALLAAGYAAGLAQIDLPFIDLEGRCTVGKRELQLGEIGLVDSSVGSFPKVKRNGSYKSDFGVCIGVPIRFSAKFFTANGYYEVKQDSELGLFDDGVQLYEHFSIFPSLPETGPKTGEKRSYHSPASLVGFLEPARALARDYPQMIKERVDEALRAHPIAAVSGLRPELKGTEAIKYLGALALKRLNEGVEQTVEQRRAYGR